MRVNNILKEEMKEINIWYVDMENQEDFEQ